MPTTGGKPRKRTTRKRPTKRSTTKKTDGRKSRGKTMVELRKEAKRLGVKQSVKGVPRNKASLSRAVSAAKGSKTHRRR